MRVYCNFRDLLLYKYVFYLLQQTLASIRVATCPFIRSTKCIYLQLLSLTKKPWPPQLKHLLVNAFLVEIVRSKHFR